METRSSPSLEQLRCLARLAEINEHDILSLSKPALFWHLRSNYDYDRLERSHQNRDGGGSGSGRKIGQNDDDHDDPTAPRSKRIKFRSSRGGGSSSRAVPSEHQTLPPASIFIQTRSRTRMLAASGGNRGVPATPRQEAVPAAQARTTVTACQRMRRLYPSGRAKSSCGRGGSSANTTNDSESSVSGEDRKIHQSSDAGESAVGRKLKRGGDGDARVGSSVRGEGGKSKGKGKGKGKARAKGSANGASESKGEGRASRDAGVSSDVTSGSGKKGDDDGDKNRPNELDPIMLVKVGKHHYRFVRPNGRVVIYNLDSLVDYFINTGDFLEPETRLPFSDEELRTIDTKVKAAGLSKPSVLEAKRDPSRYTEQKFKQDALVGLERMLSELVTNMLKVVEESDREDGEIRLVMEIFPPFADLFKQIWAADSAFAKQCMQHYTSWLQGPPNRPTEDEMGFLDIIVGFLDQLQECEGNSSLGF